MKRSFRQELIREIVHQFSRLSIFISLLMLVSLFGILIYIQFYQLNTETQQIINEYQQVKTHGQQLLQRMNRKSIPAFIQQGKNEREIYTEYYMETSNENARSVLMILDPQYQTLLSTQISSQKQMVTAHYLKTVIVAADHPQSAIRIAKGADGNDYLVFLRKVETQGKFLGYSVLLLNGNDFIPHDLAYGTRYLIADQFDHVYAKNSLSFVQGNMNKMDPTIFEHRFSYQQGQGYLTRVSLLGDNLKLYTYALFFPLKVLLLVVLITMLVMLAFLIYQSKRLAQKIGDHNTTNIELLVREVRAISLGKKKKIAIKTDDEFEFLADSINQMVLDLDGLTQQKVALEKQKAQYEKRMLEAQFNPHFLYNTLESIRIVSKFDADLAEKLILSLNRVLRYSVDHGAEDTNLMADLAIINDFLAVNQVRFEKFQYFVNVDPELLDLKIPRLFLLPVIENALKYGMRKRADLSLTIDIYRNGDQEVVFAVTDNGPGFSEQRIDQIYHQYDEEATYHGLINSYRRLKMMFPLVDLRIVDHDEGASVLFVLLEENQDVQITDF